MKYKLAEKIINIRSTTKIRITNDCANTICFEMDIFINFLISYILDPIHKNIFNKYWIYNELEEYKSQKEPEIGDNPKYLKSKPFGYLGTDVKGMKDRKRN